VPHWTPFAPSAPWRLEVSVARRPEGFAGFAELRDVMGALVFRRDFGGTPHCDNLLRDLARAIGMRVDPPMPGGVPGLSDVGAQAQPSAAPPPVVAGSGPVRDDAAQRAPASQARPAVRLGFGTWADLATAPRPAFALSIDAGVRVSWFSIALEGRWDPSAGASVMNGVSVSTQLLVGAVVPCGHAGWFIGCVVGEVGQITGTLTASAGTLTASAKPLQSQQAGLYAGGGLRIGAEIPVAPHLFLRLLADLRLARPNSYFLVPASSPTMPPSAPQLEWTTGTVTGGLGLGLVTAF
jgi:hypothetical protein